MVRSGNGRPRRATWIVGLVLLCAAVMPVNAGGPVSGERAISVSRIALVVERHPEPPVSAPCDHRIGLSVEEIDGADSFRHIGPGDVICLVPGTRGNLKLRNLHGAPGAPIVVRNDGGLVVITGTRYEAGITIIASSFLRVTGAGVTSRCGAALPPNEQACGIELRGANKGVTIRTEDADVRDIEVDHLYIHETSRDKRTRGIAIHPLEGQLVSGISIHHNHVHGTLAEGIYVGTEPNDRPFQLLPKIERLDVSYNLVEETGYDGIKIKTAIRDVRVHHNVVRDSGHEGNAAHQGGIKLAFSVGEYYNNLIVGSVEGIKMGRDLPNAGTRYYNNLIVGVRTVGLEASETGALVYNNTIVGGEVGIRVLSDDARVFDNIVVDVSGTPIEAGPSAIGRNVVGSSVAAGFVDRARGDFRLARYSPAVDAGRRQGTFPAFDHDDLPRPQGVRTDLGAFEYPGGARCLCRFRLPFALPVWID